MRTKWLYLIVALAMVLSAIPVQTSPVQAQSDYADYVLALRIPQVDFQPTESFSEVMAKYQLAIRSSWNQAESLLNAMKEAGLVSAYEPVFAANAFKVSASAQGAEQLAGLGQLLPASEAQALLEVNFMDRVQALVTQRTGQTDEEEPEAAPPAYSREDPQLHEMEESPTLQLAPATPPYAKVDITWGFLDFYTESNASIQKVSVYSSSGALKSAPGAFNMVQSGAAPLYILRIRPYTPNGDDVVLRSGDRIVVEQEGRPAFEVTIPELSAIADPVTNVVSGKAPANIPQGDGDPIEDLTRPYVYINLFTSPNLSQYVATDANGNFATNAIGDFNRGTDGYLAYEDAAGNVFWLDITAPILYVRGGDASYRRDNRLEGYVAVPNSLFEIVLRRGAVKMVDQTYMGDEEGHFRVNLYDLYGTSVPILGGDVIEVTSGGLTNTVTVPTFTVNSAYTISPLTSSISGTTDAVVTSTTREAPQTLAIWPKSSSYSGYGKYVTLTNFAFNIANEVLYYPYGDEINYGGQAQTWGGGQVGMLRYIDAEGNMVYETFMSPYQKPTVVIRGDGERYIANNYLFIFPQAVPSGDFCGQIETTLQNSAGEVKFHTYGTDTCGTRALYLADDYGNPVDILAGDKVILKQGDVTSEVVVPTFTATSDVATDKVTGSVSGVPLTGANLAVWPESLDNMGLGQQVTLTDGQFTAEGNFYSYANSTLTPFPVDINSGEKGHLRFVDANNNSVYATFQAPFDKPVMYLRGNEYSYIAQNYLYLDIPDHFVGYIDILVRNGAGGTKEHITPYVNTGTYDYYLDENLESGDVVTVVIADQTVSVTVPSFTAVSDPVQNTISGTTNADVAAVTDTTVPGAAKTLAIWPDEGTNNSGYGTLVNVSSGAFSLPSDSLYYQYANKVSYPAGTTRDWDNGRQGHLYYSDANENRVYDRFSADRDRNFLTIYKDSNRVEGFITKANQTFQLILKNGTTEKARASATSDGDFEFYAAFYDASGTPVNIQEGDTVELAVSPVFTAQVPRLNAMANPETQMITGQGPANSRIYLDGNCDFGWLYTNADGAFTLDEPASPSCLEPGDYYEVWYQKPNADHLGQIDYEVQINFRIGPIVEAGVGDSWVDGYGSKPESEVIATLKTGTTVKGQGLGWTNGGNWFELSLVTPTGAPAIIQPGDTLEVDFGGGTLVTLAVPTISMGLNSKDDIISGTGPANALLSLYFESNYYSVTTNAQGAWELDLGEMGIDIQPGESADLRYSPLLPHMLWYQNSAPVIYVRGSWDWDWGTVKYQADNFIHFVADGSPVTLNLKRGGQTIYTRNWETVSGGVVNVYLNDPFEDPLKILSGDVVEVIAGSTRTVTVPTLEATYDAAAHVLSGTGPANEHLRIYNYSSGDAWPVITGADGKFSFTAPDFDIWNYNTLQFKLVNGDWVVSEVKLLNLSEGVFTVGWDRSYGRTCANCFYGAVAASNAEVNIVLKRGGAALSSVKKLSYTNGGIDVTFVDAEGAPVNIQSGDVIEVTSGGATTTLTVPAFTAQVNQEEGTLYGTGLPGEYIGLEVTHGGGSYYIQVGLDGKFAVDSDLDSDAAGYLYYDDEKGNRFYYAWSAPYIEVELRGDSVSGYVAPGQTVLVKVMNGGSERARQVGTSGDNGWFEVCLYCNSEVPFQILPGNLVVVEVGSTRVIEVPVVDLTGSIDTAADQITGTGPANSEVDVWLPAFGTRSVETSAAGAYTVDFGDMVDLKPGAYTEIAYWNEDGNVIWTRTRATQIRVNLTNDIVDGYATDGSVVRLTLKRSGAVLARTAADAFWGFFSAFFTDSAGKLIDIQPGDVVEATASPTVTTTLGSLSVTLDLAQKLVSGTGPANTMAQVRVFYSGMLNYQDYIVLTGADGKFTQSLSELVLVDEAYLYVRYLDAGGHENAVSVLPAGSLVKEAAENRLKNEGATLLYSTFGAANSNDLTPPVSYELTKLGLVLRSYGGGLVVTLPDGTLLDNNSSLLEIDGSITGTIQVQIRSWEDDGSEYGLAIGTPITTVFGPYNLFLPLNMNNSK